jgi:hypothetical protein
LTFGDTDGIFGGTDDIGIPLTTLIVFVPTSVDGTGRENVRPSWEVG